jgi:hypothetical protein
MTSRYNFTVASIALHFFVNVLLVYFLFWTTTVSKLTNLSLEGAECFVNDSVANSSDTENSDLDINSDNDSGNDSGNESGNNHNNYNDNNNNSDIEVK